tara:strand:- start:65 stop:202 length:138 start_codon:yes stop_codon:yes gene_type:complete
MLTASNNVAIVDWQIEFNAIDLQDVDGYRIKQLFIPPIFRQGKSC